MKRLAAIIMVAGLAVLMPAFGAPPPGTVSRLTDVSKFPAEYVSVVHAVIAAVTREDLKPGEYYAKISRSGSTLHFWLIHESHDPDPAWRGDSCHKCRTVDFDLHTGEISRVFGIR